MRIALNAQLLSRSASFRSGGINRVIQALLAELARDGRGHQYDVFAPEAPSPGEDTAGPALTYHAVGPGSERPSRRIPWEQARLPFRLASLGPDLLHGLAYALPLAWRGPSVLTIYDLSFLRFPRAFNRANRLYLAAVTRASARRARRIVTISEHSKADIVRLLGVAGEQVVVAYPAADARYRPLPEDQVRAFRAQRDLPEAFLFAVGTLEPRKNLAGLLAAYARLPEPRPRLYVAGGTGWQVAPIFATVQALGLGRYVHFLGFIPEDELPLWYNSARVFVYPSLYEGFGLPVLEAMSCGIPVITSTAASLPEVAGDAAVLVPATDTSALAEALGATLESAGRRDAMRMAGLAQATRFTWRGMADTTVHTYEQAVGVA